MAVSAAHGLIWVEGAALVAATAAVELKNRDPATITPANRFTRRLMIILPTAGNRSRPRELLTTLSPN
jgi:hypothetical protein